VITRFDHTWSHDLTTWFDHTIWSHDLITWFDHIRLHKQSSVVVGAASPQVILWLILLSHWLIWLVILIDHLIALIDSLIDWLINWLLDCGVDLTDHTYPYVQILHFKFPADIDEVTVQANSESTRCAIVSVQNNTVRYILAMFLCVILLSLLITGALQNEVLYT